MSKTFMRFACSLSFACAVIAAGVTVGSTQVMPDSTNQNCIPAPCGGQQSNGG